MARVPAERLDGPHRRRGGLSPAELDVRFATVSGHLDWCMACAVWPVTHPSLDNRSVPGRALELVLPQGIVEAPYRFRTLDQAMPVLHVNPSVRAAISA